MSCQFFIPEMWTVVRTGTWISATTKWGPPPFGLLGFWRPLDDLYMPQPWYCPTETLSDSHCCWSKQCKYIRQTSHSFRRLIGKGHSSGLLVPYTERLLRTLVVGVQSCWNPELNPEHNWTRVIQKRFHRTQWIWNSDLNPTAVLRTCTGLHTVDALHICEPLQLNKNQCYFTSCESDAVQLVSNLHIYELSLR